MIKFPFGPWPIFSCKLSVFREETTSKLTSWLTFPIPILSFFQARFLRQRETTRDDEHRKTSAIPTRWTRRWSHEWQGPPIKWLNKCGTWGLFNPKISWVLETLSLRSTDKQISKIFFRFPKSRCFDDFVFWRILGQGDSSLLASHSRGCELPAPGDPI